MGELVFGTSSWSEKSWVGSFYPEGTPPAEFLVEYAREFRAVEADNTYYAVPPARMVDGWVDKTPDGFELCAKFPRSIVHGGDGPRPDPDVVLVPQRVEQETERFLEVMARMGDKLGPLVLQFPYFNKQAFPGPEPFLERLDAYLGSLPRDGYRYGVEVRNRQWVKPPLLDLLRRHGVAFVLVDLVYMPHPADLAERLDLVTADFTYGRLIGDRKAVEKETKTFDKVVLDKSDSLDRWAQLLRELGERVPKTYVFANNHYAGHGPATIRDLAALVRG